MKKIIVVAVIAFAAFSCKEAKKETENTMAAKEMAKPDVKLYTFAGGKVQANMLTLFSQDTTYQGQSREFADPFYVIVHPKGNLIWDTGLPDGLVASPEPITPPGGAFTISRKDSTIHQLKSIGLTPKDFKYIALSHTHFDHTGAANLFKDATWLVQGIEYDSITSETSKANAANGYDAIKELTNVQRLNGDHDVFGDGSVILKSTPGHTPGHMVLYLDLAENGPTLLSGDLYHLVENREHQRVPSFNYHVDQTLASMKLFEDFAKEKNAKVILQHVKEDFNKMPKAPKYLN